VITAGVAQRFTERRLRKRYATFVEPFDILTSDDNNK
jgi:hypothetical protein